MPHPMIVQDARLVQYMQAFSAVFTLPQWKYFVTVLLGVLHCDERRTLSALLRHVAVKVTIFGLCYFLRKAPWSVDALTAVRQAYFYAQIEPLVATAHAEQRAQRPRRPGRPKQTVVTGYLIIDDSTHAKRYARAQEGLGTHYSATEKKVVNGHSLYQSVYLLAGQQLPLTPRMYRRKMTCEAEGVPFASKIDMAYEEVTTFEPPPDTHTHLLIDSWYMARRIWRAARRQDWDVTGGLKCNRVMRLIEPDGTRRWVRVDQYAAGLTADDFDPVIWPTAAGDKVVYAHLVKTWVRKLGPCQVLIVKLDPNDDLEHTRYWATSRLHDTLEQVIDHVDTLCSSSAGCPLHYTGLDIIPHTWSGLDDIRAGFGSFRQHIGPELVSCSGGCPVDGYDPISGFIMGVGCAPFSTTPCRHRWIHVPLSVCVGRRGATHVACAVCTQRSRP